MGFDVEVTNGVCISTPDGTRDSPLLAQGPRLADRHEVQVVPGRAYPSSGWVVLPGGKVVAERSVGELLDALEDELGFCANHAIEDDAVAATERAEEILATLRMVLDR